MKGIGALVLVASVALPMATCSHYEDADGNRVRVEDGAEAPAGVTEVVEHTYALEDFRVLEVASWLTLIAFVWPLLALVVLRWRERGRVAIVVRMLEPLLAAGSFSLIELISTFLVDRRAVGAYVAFVGLGLYAAGAAGEDVVAYRDWKRRHPG